MSATNIALAAIIVFLQVFSSECCEERFINYEECMADPAGTLTGYNQFYEHSVSHFEALDDEINEKISQLVEEMKTTNIHCYNQVTNGLNYQDGLIALCGHCPLDHSKYRIVGQGHTDAQNCLRIVMYSTVLCEEEHEEHDHEINGDYVHDCEIESFFKNSVYKAWSACNAEQQ